MKHLKKYNESVDKFTSDNIHYFEDPEMKSVVEETLSHIKDLTSDSNFGFGWIVVSPDTLPHFMWDQDINKKEVSRWENPADSKQEGYPLEK